MLAGTREWFLKAKQTKTISVARSLGIVPTYHRYSVVIKTWLCSIWQIYHENKANASELISPLSHAVTKTKLRGGSCTHPRSTIEGNECDLPIFTQARVVSVCTFFPSLLVTFFWVKDVNSTNVFTEPKARQSRHFTFNGPCSYLTSVRQGHGTCLISSASIPAVGLTQPSFQ
jgi:hypothetical protein